MFISFLCVSFLSAVWHSITGILCELQCQVFHLIISHLLLAFRLAPESERILITLTVQKTNKYKYLFL